MWGGAVLSSPQEVGKTSRAPCTPGPSEDVLPQVRPRARYRDAVHPVGSYRPRRAGFKESVSKAPAIRSGAFCLEKHQISNFACFPWRKGVPGVAPELGREDFINMSPLASSFLGSCQIVSGP